MEEAIPNPWLELRGMPHIELLWATDLPPDVRAATDGIARIWIRKLPLQRQRRSALVHELEHYRAGHRGCQPPKVERHVRAMAARWLLPDIRRVMDDVVFHGGINDPAADGLWVDLTTLRARFDDRHISPREIAYAKKRMEDIHGRH